MNSFIFSSNSEDETKDFACNCASIIPKKCIIVLLGDLGSGKTKFTEGFCRFYGLDKEISSPTFNIVNEYQNDDICIFHFDVYRLEDSSEFYEIGGEEYFEKGICLVEWGEIVKDVFPDEYIEIKFSRDLENESDRILEITSYGSKYDDLLNEMKNF